MQARRMTLLSLGEYALFVLMVVALVAERKEGGTDGRRRLVYHLR